MNDAAPAAHLLGATDAVALGSGSRPGMNKSMTWLRLLTKSGVPLDNRGKECHITVEGMGGSGGRGGVAAGTCHRQHRGGENEMRVRDFRALLGKTLVVALVL